MRDVAAHFRVKKPRTEQIVREVVAVAKGWRNEARAMGISRAEQERMANALAVAES